jgi:hypothetical protein
MARPRAIPIYLYSLNARGRAGILDYEELFTSIASTDVAQTLRAVARDLNFAIDITEVETTGATQHVFTGHVIAGSPEGVPLFFDYITGETEVGATPDGKWLAQLSRVVISVSAAYRYVALEGGRNGVTAARLGSYLALLAETILGVTNVEFDVIPVQSDSLRSEIESFERIKQATAIVARPNLDWNDFSDKLSRLAEESTGHEAEATVRAARGETLSKDAGIVGTILGSLGSRTPAIRQFKVTGRKPNSDRDTVVTSEKYQERAFARLGRSASAVEIDQVIYDEATTLIDRQIPDDIPAEGQDVSGHDGAVTDG